MDSVDHMMLLVLSLVTLPYVFGSNAMPDEDISTQGTSENPLVLWECHGDICEQNKHFCNHQDKRCSSCADFDHMCFSTMHQPNCTRYCKNLLEQELKERRCENPPEIPNGKHNAAKTSFQQGETVSYSCYTRHRLKGFQNITCMPFGQWSDRPICEVITCPVPKTPKDGRALINSSYPASEKTSFHVGETVKYLCDAGHTLIGVSHGYCTNEGQIDHTPPVCVTENSKIVYQILLSVVTVLLVISIAAHIRSYCKKRKHSKMLIFANGHIPVVAEGEQGQALLEDHITSGTIDPLATVTSETRSNGVIYENEQTSRVNLGAVPVVDNNNRHRGSNDSLTDSNVTSDDSVIENTASITNNNCNNTTTSGSIPVGNNNTGSIVNTNINNNGGHVNRSDSVNNNNINNGGNHTVNIHLHIPSVNQQSSPDKTAYDPEPTGIGRQEEGQEDATTTKFSDVQPLAPRGQAQPCEHYQPHSSDEGEKAIGTINAEIPSAVQELSKRLSNHQQEQQDSPAKITTASGEVDRQDFEN